MPSLEEIMGSSYRADMTAEDVTAYFKNKVFNTIIPRLVRLVEAPSHGKPISDYDPESRATLAYQNLAKEVISRNGN